MVHLNVKHSTQKSDPHLVESRLRIGIAWSLRELPAISYIQEMICQWQTIWENAHMSNFHESTNKLLSISNKNKRS
jgi:hypothetical protein